VCIKFQGIEGGVEGRQRVIEPVRPQHTYPISKRVSCSNADLIILSSKGSVLIKDDLKGL